MTEAIEKSLKRGVKLLNNISDDEYSNIILELLKIVNLSCFLFLSVFIELINIYHL
ncbi:hypothetical protein SAMN05216503_2094 [Polaribacter sp. KT25b]|nr:hypothetical protein SAMN05216503_2094 [Polaribacter sp. KT25b]